MDGFLPWIGGKSRLSGQIARHITGVKHDCYVEPFMGAAHVFFRRETPAKTEVLNDANRELVTLFRVLQWHLEEFFRYFKWALVSRDEFERLRTVAPDTLTDIQRAARFYYLQKLCYGGRAKNATYGASMSGKPRLNLLRMEEQLSEVHLRLSQVQIECLPWAECIRRYDREHTLFYIDPPYYGCEDYYGKDMFGREEYAQMAELLARLKGRFILSLNDTPEVRAIFNAFHTTEVRVRYSVGKPRSKENGELLISNVILKK